MQSCTINPYPHVLYKQQLMRGIQILKQEPATSAVISLEGHRPSVSFNRTAVRVPTCCAVSPSAEDWVMRGAQWPAERQPFLRWL